MKLVKKTLSLLTLFALPLLLLPSCQKKNAPAGDKTFIISAIPDEKISDQEIKFQALSKYLQQELGVPVEFTISSDYATAVQRFANGEVHLVWFGGLSGVQARAKVPGARAIAQGKSDPHFKSYFIANTKTGLTKKDEFPAEISTYSFTFGSPGSTSGRLMPAYFIEQNTGKKVEDFFTQPVQFQEAGGHHATAKAVESGTVQTGVLNYRTYDSMVKSGDLDPERARIIWVTPDYPDYNFSAHPALSEMFGDDFLDKLQKALVDCQNPEVLGAINRDGIIPAKNEDYTPIVDVAKELDMLR